MHREVLDCQLLQRDLRTSYKLSLPLLIGGLGRDRTNHDTERKGHLGDRKVVFDSHIDISDLHLDVVDDLGDQVLDVARLFLLKRGGFNEVVFVLIQE